MNDIEGEIKMPFEKIDAKKKIKETLENDPTFAKGFEETKREFELISEIIERRKTLGYNQKDLAERIGAKQQVISKFETQKESPTLSKFLKILDSIGLDIELVEKVK